MMLGDRWQPLHYQGRNVQEDGWWWTKRQNPKEVAAEGVVVVVVAVSAEVLDSVPEDAAVVDLDVVRRSFYYDYVQAHTLRFSDGGGRFGGGRGDRGFGGGRGGRGFGGGRGRGRDAGKPRMKIDTGTPTGKKTTFD